MSPRFFTFIGGETGPWRVARMEAVIGEGLPAAGRLDVVSGEGRSVGPGVRWVLRGIRSNERYLTREEKDQLTAKQEPIGRPAATRAALIPIRKSPAWWELSQDERRRVFEEQSRHVGIGLEYLPAIARRLHHCRDLSESEPFDFLTWFDYAPEHEAAFDEMLARLRASEEWRYVEREVDVRLVRDETSPTAG